MSIKNIKNVILYAAVVFVVAWNYEMVWKMICFVIHAFFPFFLGGAIAFILNVPMAFIEKKVFGRKNKFSRRCSLFFTIFLLVGIGGLICYIVVPELKTSVMELFSILPQNIWQKIQDNVRSFLKEGMLGLAKSVISGMVNFVIAIVFSIYILLQKEKLCVQAKKLMYAFLPKDWTEIFLALFKMAGETFSNFLSGQFLEALILGGMFLVALSLFRVPHGMLISILIAGTALVPVVGAFAGCIVGVFLILTADVHKVFLFVVIFLILQQVEGNLIYPKVVGGSVGLPAIWVLVAVGIGTGLWGIMGAVVLIPISAIVYSLLRGIVHRRLLKRGIKVERETYIVNK